jgi:predicted site-specific integrase-resolvase
MPTDTDSSSSDRAWLKPRDLAEREGVDRRTIWRWVEKGLVEARRLDARTGVRVRVADGDDD